MQFTDFLRKVPLFEELDDRSLNAIAAGAIEQNYPPGHEIVREGDTGVGAYIIRSGRVEVVQSRGGQPVKLAELTTGDFFGDMALIDEFPRSATVRAVEPTTCLGLTRWHFRGVLDSYPEIALRILPVLTRRIRNCERALTEAMRH